MKNTKSKTYILTVKTGGLLGIPIHTDVPVADFMRSMLSHVRKNGAMTIRDFGTFRVVKSASRKCFNTFAGETIAIKPRLRLRFTQARSLGRKLNEPKKRKKV